MSRSKRSRPSLETLETRTTPAALNGRVLTFLDADGDTATVTLSRTLPVAVSPDSVFRFDIGGVDGDTTITRQQLQQIDLTALGVNGMSLTARVIKTGTEGDGQVNIGWVNGNNLDVGTVTIAGDLGRMTAGNTNPTVAGLAGLSVVSLGRFGTSTQAAGGTLESVINGPLGSVRVAGDVNGASLFVVGFGSAGRLGALAIGGRLIGADADGSGTIATGGPIGLVNIGSDIVGGTGALSGMITAGRMGPVRIAGDLIGGTGASSAVIWSDGNIGPVTVGGSVLGGNGPGSATILSVLGNIGTILVSGDIRGGTGDASASVRAVGYVDTIFPTGLKSYADPGPKFRWAGGRIASITVGGSIMGGDGENSGIIRAEGAGSLGPVRIAGGLIGGAGAGSAAITAEKSQIDREYGAPLLFGGRIASVFVGRDVTGGDGPGSASVRADRAIGPVRAGSLAGGAGAGSAAITAVDGNIGAVLVAGNVTGGTGEGSASIRATGHVEEILLSPALAPTYLWTGGRIASVTVRGSVTGNGPESAAIVAESAGAIGPVRIAGGLAGGVGDGSASIRAESTTPDGNRPLLVFGGNIASIFVGGDVAGGTGKGSACIQADRAIGIISAMGNWTAASIAAGYRAGPDRYFNTADDERSFGGTASITAINIAGAVQGTAGTGDSFAFLAGQIGSLRVGGISLTTGGNDIPLGSFGDFQVA